MISGLFVLPKEKKSGVFVMVYFLHGPTIINWLLYPNVISQNIGFLSYIPIKPNGSIEFSYELVLRHGYILISLPEFFSA